MSADRSKQWRQLCERHFPQLEFDCGHELIAGVTDTEAWRDWSELETTPDQLRIEAYIARFDLQGKKILHVGAGNSRLAERFHSRLEAITGTTIEPAELRAGAKLGLSNYRILMHNKYLKTDRPSGKYDFIIDNNPTSFCCCLKHLRVMFEWYSSSLDEDGQIITDRIGLGWVPEIDLQNHRWKFEFEDLKAIAPFFNLSAFRINKNTYVLSRKRPEFPKSGLVLSSVWSNLRRTILSRTSFLAGS